MSAKPSARRTPKRPSQGRADFARMLAMTEEDIERTSPPELRNLPADFWDDATLVAPLTKQAISLRVDRDVLDWFKAQGPRYQSRMNAVLRSYMVRQQERSVPAAVPRPRRRSRRPS